MKLLGIDTTSNVAAVAVMDDEKCLGEMLLNHPKTHSQKMMPIIESLLRELELEMTDLDGVAVSSGPGSFTGVRIGMATAKALGHACGLPVYTVSALEAMSYNVPVYNGLICPIMDARRDQVYTAVFKLEDGILKRELEDSALSISELMEHLKTYNESVLFLGDGITRFREYITDDLDKRAVFAPEHIRLQRASSVCYTVLKNSSSFTHTRYDQAEANYLRKSQAEREYDAKHNK